MKTAPTMALPNSPPSPEGCAKCGACVPVCPIFQLTGRESHTARGKLHLLQTLSAETYSPYFAELLSLCLLCGACADICPRKLDPTTHFIRARGLAPDAAEKAPFTRYLLQELMARPMASKILSAPLRAALTLVPANSGLRLRLGIGKGELTGSTTFSSYAGRQTDHQGPDKVLYFTGCLANYLELDIAHATDFLLTKLTGAPSRPPRDQGCCGLALAGAGDLPRARDAAKKNIIAFESAGQDLPILTSCASCYAGLQQYPSLLADNHAWQERAGRFINRVEEFSSFFVKRGMPELLQQHAGNKDRPSATWHDPCHLRFGPNITAEPRQLLAPAATLIEPAGGPQCCGQGGLFHLAHPEEAHSLADALVSKIMTGSPQRVLTSCSGCLLHLRQHLTGRQKVVLIQHPAILLRELFS